MEDDLALQQVLARLLRSTGIVVDAAARFTEGLHRLRTNPPPHCVLLDLNLPDGDGTKIPQHICAKGIATKVAVVTGTANRTLLIEVMKLLPDKVLKKHFGTRDVQEWVGMALELQEVARIRRIIGVEAYANA